MPSVVNYTGTDVYVIYKDAKGNTLGSKTKIPCASTNTTTKLTIPADTANVIFAIADSSYDYFTIRSVGSLTGNQYIGTMKANTGYQQQLQYCNGSTSVLTDVNPVGFYIVIDPSSRRGLKTLTGDKYKISLAGLSDAFQDGTIMATISDNVSASQILMGLVLILFILLMVAVVFAALFYKKARQATSPV